jgi:hypothetical protein
MFIHTAPLLAQMTYMLATKLLIFDDMNWICNASCFQSRICTRPGLTIRERRALARWAAKNLNHPVGCGAPLWAA